MITRLLLLPALMLAMAALDARPAPTSAGNGTRVTSEALAQAQLPAQAPAIELASASPVIPHAPGNQHRTAQQTLLRQRVLVAAAPARHTLADVLDASANSARERAGFLSFHTSTPPPPQG